MADSKMASQAVLAEMQRKKQQDMLEPIAAAEIHEEAGVRVRRDKSHFPTYAVKVRIISFGRTWTLQIGHLSTR